MKYLFNVECKVESGAHSMSSCCPHTSASSIMCSPLTMVNRQSQQQQRVKSIAVKLKWKFKNSLKSPLTSSRSYIFQFSSSSSSSISPSSAAQAPLPMRSMLQRQQQKERSSWAIFILMDDYWSCSGLVLLLWLAADVLFQWIHFTFFGSIKGSTTRYMFTLFFWGRGT